MQNRFQTGQVAALHMQNRVRTGQVAALHAQRNAEALQGGTLRVQNAPEPGPKAPLHSRTLLDVAVNAPAATGAALGALSTTKASPTFWSCGSVNDAAADDCIPQ
jgi:hypothetical protein